MKTEKHLWEEAVAFHGHVCPGLATGFRAAMVAKKLLDITGNQEDEQAVCIAETDACGVDAIQSALKITLGTGSLRINFKGKNAFTFYNRLNGKAARILFLGHTDGSLSREEKINILLNESSDKLFSIKEITTTCPERVQMSPSRICPSCGEPAAEHIMIEKNGTKLCLDCSKKG